jgi:MFS family permease
LGSAGGQFAGRLVQHHCPVRARRGLQQRVRTGNQFVSAGAFRTAAGRQAVAGVLVDRYDRKLILIYCNISRTGVVLMFLLVTSADRLWMIYALSIIQFTLSALFEPGQAAITPSLIGQKDLVLANTLGSITWSVMLALGAIIGGAVAAIFGSATALIVDSSTFAIAALLIARITVLPQEEEEPASEARSREKMADSGSLRDGLRYVRAHPATAAMLMVKGGASATSIP